MTVVKTRDKLKPSIKRKKMIPAVFRSNRLPSCATQQVCSCFEELSIFDGSFVNMLDYTRKVKQQLEYFLHIIQIHQSKEKLLNTPESTKIKGVVIRTALFYANLTRNHFLEQLLIQGNCIIRIPSKTVHLRDFLTRYEKLYQAWDVALVICYKPESDLPMLTLKSFLESHLELILIFEKYNQLICSSKTVSISTCFEMQEVYHLMY